MQLKSKFGFGACLVLVFGPCLGRPHLSRPQNHWQTRSDSSPQTVLQLQRIDAGGHKLNMLIGGEGTPAVVFEAGFRSDLTAWSMVQSDVASFARTVSYDRAGL